MRLDWIEATLNEVARARKKFPNPDLLTTAFAEEAGELVKAILDNYHGKPSNVYEEAIQVIAMAVRLIEEGDPVHRLEPKQSNAEQVVRIVAVLPENLNDRVAFVRCERWKVEGAYAWVDPEEVLKSIGYRFVTPKTQEVQVDPVELFLLREAEVSLSENMRLAGIDPDEHYTLRRLKMLRLKRKEVQA